MRLHKRCVEGPEAGFHELASNVIKLFACRPVIGSLGSCETNDHHESTPFLRIDLQG
jgi:hypothetical protein